MENSIKNLIFKIFPEIDLISGMNGRNIFPV
ncbi:hypothetical protein MPF_1800 [Methanohalophilus portucalensis FDF-1]|uniref:Uncharacterized protein n=1 Tax=Methanohalophilus portucalensis FDF-1 TaxID=523843 RepID=A0A1L9C2R3_9EURY|nr:hypothetical protein MPF_1800 [Methanohalophilus portucalensis FDF-1]